MNKVKNKNWETEDDAPEEGKICLTAKGKNIKTLKAALPNAIQFYSKHMYSHAIHYWDSEGMAQVAKEAYAEFSEAWSDPLKMMALEEYVPNAYQAFRSLQRSNLVGKGRYEGDFTAVHAMPES